MPRDRSLEEYFPDQFAAKTRAFGASGIGDLSDSEYEQVQQDVLAELSQGNLGDYLQKVRDNGITDATILDFATRSYSDLDADEALARFKLDTIKGVTRERQHKPGTSLYGNPVEKGLGRK